MMQPNGLLLLLEEPYLGPSRSGANIRAMVSADALRHRLKVAQRYFQIRKYLAARKEVPVSKRAREPSPPLDDDAMVVDDITPVHKPVKRGRFEAPRSARDRPFRRLATCMRVYSGAMGVKLAMRQEAGTVQVVFKSTRPVQPAVRPRWRPNDMRPKFSVASLQTEENFRYPLAYHYALHLRLRPQEGDPRHAALLHHRNIDDVYKTPIDTGDWIYWFFQDDFAVADNPIFPWGAAPVDIPSLDYASLSVAEELAVTGSDPAIGYELDVSFESHVDAPVEVGEALYDVSLSLRSELESSPSTSGIDGNSPGMLSTGSWDEISLSGENFALDPAYIGHFWGGSSSRVVSNALADTTKKIPTKPVNVTDAVLLVNATDDARARTNVHMNPSSGTSRAAVSPSDTSATQHHDDERSKGSRIDGAETCRPQTVESYQSSPRSPHGGTRSPITPLVQGSTEAVGVDSLPGASTAEPQVSPEGVAEPTHPLFASEHESEDGPQQPPSLLKRTIPPGIEGDLKDTRRILYGDGGSASLNWWSIRDTAVPFEFPSWCWNSNTEGATSLELSRILANQVNARLAGQDWDGNFGLAIPGWKDPFNSSNAKPEDQVTFYDVLQHNDSVRVDKPWIMTLRLLWPQDQSRSSEKAKGRASDDRVRSFVYFGDGEPCAVLGSSDTGPVAPQWGPRIPVWPQPLNNDAYNLWRLQLLSMTLLKPLCDDPDFTVSSHWEAIEIDMPASSPGGRGIEALLDTGSTRSHFPAEIVAEITRLWLKDPEQIQFPSGSKDIYVKRPEDYENFDIVFKFLGSDNEVVNFRCGARDFLVSPYKVDDYGYYCPLAEHGGIDNLVAPFKWCALGTNFFWCAMTRLVAPLHDGTKGGLELTRAERPYVQLAPQRLVLDGRKVAGPRDFQIYEEHPPWFQPGKHEPMYMNH